MGATAKAPLEWSESGDKASRGGDRGGDSRGDIEEGGKPDGDLSRGANP